MAIYYFYTKSGNVVTVQKDHSGDVDWLAQGYQKEFEEVDAATSTAALQRFWDIRAEQEKTQWAFMVWPAVFCAFVLVIFLIAL